MTHFARLLSAVLLALALLTLPAAAHADPAPRAPGTADGWITTVLDLLGGLVGGLWLDSPSTTDPLEVDDGDSEALPGWDPNGVSSNSTTTTQGVPSWDPNG